MVGGNGVRVLWGLGGGVGGEQSNSLDYDEVLQVTYSAHVKICMLQHVIICAFSDAHQIESRRLKQSLLRKGVDPDQTLL